MVVLFVKALPSFSLAAAIFSEALEQSLPVKNRPRFIARDYGRSFSEVDTSFISDLLMFRPDIIGFSNFFWSLKKNITLAGIAKTILPQTRIIFGGPQVGLIDNAINLMKQHPAIDFTLCGEGDITFPLLLKQISRNNKMKNPAASYGVSIREISHVAPQGAGNQTPIWGLNQIPGLVFREGARFVSGPAVYSVTDLAEIPTVYHDKNSFVLRNASINELMPLQTLRGCKNHCSYCLYCIDKLRLFPLKRVENEIRFLCARRFNNVRVSDSHFGGPKARAMELLRIIRHYNKGTCFSIYPDPDHIDAGYIRAAKSAGCQIISLGLETLDPVVARRVNRKTNAHKMVSVINTLQKNNVNPQVDLVFGLPQQQFHSFKNDVLFLKKHGVTNILFSPLMIFPGTALDKQSVQEKMNTLPAPQNYAFPLEMGLDDYAKCHRLILLFQLTKILYRTEKYIQRTQKQAPCWLEDDKILASHTLLDINEDMHAAASSIRANIRSSIKKISKLLCPPRYAAKHNVLNDVIRFDLMEWAMKQRFKECERELKKNNTPHVCDGKANLKPSTLLLDNDVWLDSFTAVPELFIKHPLSRPDSTHKKTYCAFCCPSATIHFLTRQKFASFKQCRRRAHPRCHY
ncbi:MAG: B12-binding domain-containing radical SAM protein [Deltaproteobacteria bacterium]|nr:B12-binding domain-containing radical SAM protein [Deltaproteobacteria bacterium]